MKGSGLTVAVAAALFAPIQAQRPHFPRATGSAVLPSDGWTPRPTPPPGLSGLRKRQNRDDEEDEDGTTVFVAPDNTCGYVDARAGAHFTCSADYSCVFFTATAGASGYVGCCDEISCGIRLDCIDYDSFYSSSACDNGCQVDAYTLKCMDEAMPYCNTLSFSSNIIDYWCNSLDISTAQSAATAFAGDDRTFEPLVLDDVISSYTFEEDTTAPGPSITADPTATATGDADDDDDADSDRSNSDNDDDRRKKDDGGSSTPVGPIVGGVVGGVAAIGLGGLGLWLFFRNKKKKQAASSSQSPSVVYAPVQQGGPPHPGMSPSPGQGYQQPGGYYDPNAAQTYQYPQQTGGFQPQQQQSATSPPMSYVDRNGTSSPSAVYPSGISTSSPGNGPQQAYPSGVSMSSPASGHQQPGFIAEAPSRPEDSHRGGVHELA